jgi:hypothetical protein
MKRGRYAFSQPKRNVRRKMQQCKHARCLRRPKINNRGYCGNHRFKIPNQSSAATSSLARRRRKYEFCTSVEWSKKQIKQCIESHGELRKEDLARLIADSKVSMNATEIVKYANYCANEQSNRRASAMVATSPDGNNGTGGSSRSSRRSSSSSSSSSRLAPALCFKCHWSGNNRSNITVHTCRVVLKHTGPNWQQSFVPPPGVSFYDFELQRHVKPMRALGNQTMRDTYERRLDRLSDQKERRQQHIQQHQQQQQQQSSTTNTRKRRKTKATTVDSSGSSGGSPPLLPLVPSTTSLPSPPSPLPLPLSFSYMRTDLDVRSRNGAAPSLQAQHYRQLSHLLEQMAAGHDWVGAADVLTILCNEFRELTYSAYTASLNVYSHALNVIQLDNKNYTVFKNNLIRFLRSCIQRNVPYSHIALRDLALFFVDRKLFVDGRTTLKQYADKYPYSSWPDVHGLLGICCFELMYDLKNGGGDSAGGSQSTPSRRSPSRRSSSSFLLLPLLPLPPLPLPRIKQHHENPTTDKLKTTSKNASCI